MIAPFNYAASMNRNALIGCGGLFLAAVILVGVLILETPKFLDQGKSLLNKIIADEARIAALEADWQPPSAAVDGQWFPVQVAGSRLERSGPTAGIPELDIDRAGQHGSYRSSLGNVEVDIIPANDLEKATLLKRAEDALSRRRDRVATTDAGGVQVSVNRGSSRVSTTRGNRTHVRIGADDHTRFWWVKGTLFIFRARGATDSESFPEEYLRALSPRSAAKIEKE